MSDPDYDIPRPHRSLVFEPKTENPENVIPATRFFGPVLESSDFQDIRQVFYFYPTGPNQKVGTRNMYIPTNRRITYIVSLLLHFVTKN